MTSIEAPDRMYEDNMRIGIDLIDLYLHTRESRYLEKAELIWKFISEGIDNRFGGGIYSSEWSRKVKSPVTNAYGAVFGTRLYQATDNQDYLDMAKGMYIWAQENQNDQCLLGEYNGLMIQAGSLLFRISERTGYLEDARALAKENSHLMTGGSDPWNNVLMVRGLVELYHTDGEPEYLNSLRKALEASWTSGQRPAGRAEQTAQAEIYSRLGDLLNSQPHHN